MHFEVRQRRKVFEMTRVTNYLLLGSLLIAGISPAQGAEKKSEAKATVIVARPRDNSLDASYGWVAPTAEQLFYTKLDVVEDITIIPWSTLDDQIRKYNVFTEPVTESKYFDVAQKEKATHLVLQRYEVVEGSRVDYLAELVSIEERKAVSTFERSFPISALGSELDAAMLQFVTAVGSKPSGHIARFLRMPILGKNEKALAELGELIKRDKYGEKVSALAAAKDFEKIAGADRTMVLAGYLSGTRYIEANKYADAASMLDGVLLAIGPIYPDLYVATCRGYREARRYDDALRIAMLAEKAGIDSPDLAAQKAQILEDKGDQSGAYDAYKKVLTSNPNQPDALVFMAEHALRDNNADKALEFAQKALKNAPNQGRAHIVKGKVLLEMKRVSEAQKSFSDAATLMPDSPEPHVLLGQIYFDQKNYSRAAVHYEQASRELQANLDVHLRAAEALKRSKKTREAMELLAKKESTFSREPEFQQELGLLRLALKDSSRAKIHFENFVKSGGQDGEVFLALGNIYLKDGDPDKALTMLIQARPRVKDRIPCEFAMGKIYLSKQQYQQAINHLKEVVAERPSHKEAHGILADAYLASKDRKNALTHYLRQRTNAGSSRELQQRIADLYYELNSMKQAAEEYKQLLKMDSQNGDAYFRIAGIYLQQKNLSVAEAYLKDGMKLKKPSPDLLLEFGKAFWGAKSYSKAIDIYLACVDLDPKNQRAFINLVELYQKQGKDSLSAEMSLRVYALDNDANKEYLSRAGKLFEKAKAPEKAEKVYEEFLGKHTDPNVSERLARIEYKNKNYKNALEQLEKSGALHSADLDLLMMLAESYFAEKQYDKVLTPAKKVIAKQPKHGRAVELAALSYERIDDIPHAIKMYEKFMDFNKHKDYAFHLAELYEKAGREEDAIGRYKKNTIYYASDPRNYHRLAFLYSEKNNYTAALPILQKSLDVPGTAPELQRMYAQALAKKGNSSQAIKHYRDYLAKAPNDSSALFELGALYYKGKDYKHAVEYLSRASVLMPKNYDLHMMLGHSYAKAGKVANAVDPFERAHSIEPKKPEPLEYLSIAFRKLQKNDKLIPVLTKLAALKPKDFETVFELGKLLVLDGKGAEALVYLQAAGKLNPNNVETQMMLADVYEKQNNDALRVIHLENALKLSPKNFEVNMALGLYHSARRSLKDARRYLGNATGIRPNNAAAHYEYGKVSLAMNEPTDALASFQKALTYDDDNLEYALRVVETSHQLGRKDAALKVVQKSLTMKGSENSSEAQYWAGVLFHENGKPEVARAYFDKAVALDKNCAVCYDYLGDIYFANSSFEEAAKHYDKSLSVNRNNPKTEMKLGAALLNAGKKGPAERLFERAVGENSNNDEARYWLCHLYLESDRIDLARQVYEKRPSKGKTGWYYLLSGEIAEANKSYRTAVNAYTTAAKLLPENANALAGKGRMYIQLKRYDQAIMFLGQAMGYDPKNTDLMVEMARAYDGQNDRKAAMDLLKEVIKGDPQNENAYFHLARLEAKKDHLRAITTIKTGLDENSRSGKLYLALGHEYRLTSQYDNAIDAYKKAERFGGKSEQLDALKSMGDIYFMALKDTRKAKGYYEKYIKEGGDDSAVKMKLGKL